MRYLTIHRLYFTASDCYMKGVRQTPSGVQVHSTGANNPYLRRYVQPDDGYLGVNPNGNSHNRPGGNVCASAYIGKLQDGSVAVYQTLPWGMRCWLSGSGKEGNANKLGYIGFEICEDNCKDRQYFEAAVKGAAVLLTAHLCKMMGVTPWYVSLELPDGSAYAVMDHAGLHSVGLASNHGDIGLWMRNFGYSFDDFRAWVQQALDEGVEATYVDAKEADTMSEYPTLRPGSSSSDVMALQCYLEQAGFGETLGDAEKRVDGKYGAKTEAAVRAFQSAHGLKPDGICGPLTWAALIAAVSPEETHETEEPPAEPVLPSSLLPEIITIPRAHALEIRACLRDALALIEQAFPEREDNAKG